MKTSSIILGLGVVGLSSGQEPEPDQEPIPVPNTFIVRFREDSELTSGEGALDKVLPNIADSSVFARVKHDINLPGFKGFTGVLSPSVVDELNEDENVADVIQSFRRNFTRGPVAQYYPYGKYGYGSGVDTVTQQDATWGIDRIDSEEGLDGSYTYPSSAGEGVTCYVIDSVVDADHDEFEGRVTLGPVFVDGNNEGFNDHGTHVAGTMAGKTYGVAKKCRIVSVTVLDDWGWGTDDGIMAGMSWIAQDGKDKPSVCNMSLGWNFPFPLGDALLDAAWDAGTIFNVASGNNDGDACDLSPVSKKAMMVGASNRNDTRTSFSNWGSCQDIYAPGLDITSAGSGGGSLTLSGTSMASPHVAGAIALLLGDNPDLSPQQVKDLIMQNAEYGIITDPKGPNVFLHTNPEGDDGY